jgi:DNA-binding MarR family transcriptional regulator
MVKNFTKLERRQKLFVNRALATSGLNGMMVKYIVSIKYHPGTSQDYLAEFHSVDKSRVARVVRELEKLGYITRTIDEKNRRINQLYLTEAGDKLFYTINSVLTDWGLLISRDIPNDDIALTVGTLARMIENANSNK